MIFDRTNPGEPIAAGDLRPGDIVKLDWGLPILVDSVEDSGEASFTTVTDAAGVRHIFDSSKIYQVHRAPVPEEVS